MGKAIDITGQKFNHLTAIEPTDQRVANGSIVWHFHRTNLEYAGVNVHDSTVEHDKRKTKYCIDNKIPLYRLYNEDTVHNELEKILKEI